MYRSVLAGLLVFSFVVFADGNTAFGQSDTRRSSPNDPTPRSSRGGHAGRELRSLYRSDVGQGFTIASQNALAMQRAQARVPYVGQSTTASGPNNRISLGLSPSRTSKPFANTSSRPTVSPYLNLFREDLGGTNDFNYHTLVRPQLQQQQVNRQVQDQARATSQRVQQLSARSAFNAQGSQNQSPTGHQTVFGYYGRYYPGLSGRRR